MRRTIVLLTTMAMTLLGATSVAMAASVVCPANTTSTILCKGTIGNDIMTGTEATYYDPIEPGFAWGDKILGYGGNDTLNARGGPDQLDGGPGNDTLNGGNGKDTYLFEDGWGVDTVTSPQPRGDILDFSKLTQRVTVKNNRATSYHPASGTSTLDWDPTVLFGVIKGGAGGDILNANSWGTYLYGAAGQDYLMGGLSNDELVGGAGPDYFVGGSGNDTIRADDLETDQIVNCGDGDDIVYYDRTRDFPDQFIDCEVKIAKSSL